MNLPSREWTVPKTVSAQMKKKLSGKQVLVYPGSIFGKKGLYRYFDIVETLRDTFPEIYLLLVGIIRHENTEDISRYLSWPGIHTSMS